MEERMSRGNGVRVCVTGGAGFIGSWLVKKLLNIGYTVHATLRNIGDEEKAGLLRRLVPGAAESGRLALFEADLFDAATFAPAIAGCEFVFLVATLLRHDATSTKYKSTAVAAQDAARVILRHSMAACSPLREESAGFKDAVDEFCWTPLDVDYPLRSAQYDEYILSKLVSEKELLAYNAGESPAFEVVTGGTTVSLEGVALPATRDERQFIGLRMLQQLLGSMPLAHVDDVCDALVYCMEWRPSMASRFLCAAATEALPSVRAHSDKLGELGFRYKYGMEEILDGSI
uniref:NAD-dependent epimerase/dehydratase domain-containing protein n=1 Tax=Setaria italica TaxID=4555 RepID=K3Y2M4_SETIT